MARKKSVKNENACRWKTAGPECPLDSLLKQED